MDPYRQQYPPYPGQPPQQQQQQQGAPPPHLRHGPPPPGSLYGPPPPHLQGRPPHMYQGAPPPHLQQPYAPHMQGPPPHQQQPPHFQGRGPMPPQRPGAVPPGQYYPPGSGAGGPYGAVPPLSGPPPQGVYPSQHQRMPRPTYGPGSLPPPTGAGTSPGSGPMNLGGPVGFNAPSSASGFNKGAPSGVNSGNAIPASAFVVGGALPDKMNTLFIGSIAPGINNIAMEKLLKTTGNLVKWKRVQDPTSHQWKAFGFAEYADADSLLRTLRVLGQDGQQPKGEKPVGLELTAMDGSGIVKALLVKADEKTRQFLDQYEESRPRTIHDTEKDKVALVNANKIIQKMKDGTLDTSEPEQRSDDKEDSNTAEDNMSKKTEDQDTGETEVSEEQKELIARELNFFRERAALKEKEKREEEEKAERQRAKHQRDRDNSSQSGNSSHRTAGRERAWGSNSTTLGTRLTEFVPAGGSNHTDAGPTAGPPNVATAATTATRIADQDPGVDSEEEEKARQERREREQEHVYKDRERRWEQREVERMRQYEKDKVRDEEYTLEHQSTHTTMAQRFAQWNDDVEREKRHEEYYRDRSRWWQRRQAFLQKEERYDALDREEEREELEQEAAKKAQEEAAAAAALATPSVVDHDGDSEMKDASNIDSTSISAQASAGSLDLNPGVDATILPNQPTKFFKLNLAANSGLLKRGGSEASSGVGTPTSGFVAATEFEYDDEDKEVKKRRVLMPFKYGDDDVESESKKSHSGAVNGGTELKQEEKEIIEREIKALMQLIPADAQGLWNWPIQWQYVFEDNNLILTEKIQPFASKKVVELLGVQEDELTNFVIEHIRQKKPPQELVDELRNALDNDADILVMKIWRMLIFETESKARKLSSK
ncbi:hypothetical protein BGX27_004094 [Mortierella sp. AM989]|nr:hypothetical protein BGX27_004094 [Mortierella sp. AM989]